MHAFAAASAEFAGEPHATLRQAGGRHSNILPNQLHRKGTKIVKSPVSPLKDPLDASQ